MMEDGNGLELSLGLSCGGSSGQSKIKDASAEAKVDEGSSNRLTGCNDTGSEPSFKKFFLAGTENQDQKGKQKTDPDFQQCENFWTDLGRCSTTVADPSSDVQNNLFQFNRYQELWASNRRTDAEEENTNKRKMPFKDMNFQNKHDKVVDFADARGKSPTVANLMRNSLATEDASSGVVNEGVAESEAEGSNSWLVAQCEEKSKISDTSKFADKRVTCDPGGIGSNGLKDPSLLRNDSNHEPGKVTYGIPLSREPVTVMTVPYPVPVKVTTNVNAPNAMGITSASVMQLMPVANSEPPAAQTMNTSNLQLSFGFSPVQLPTLETGSSWAFKPQTHCVTPHVNRDEAPSKEHSDDLKASHGNMTGRVNWMAEEIYREFHESLKKYLVTRVPIQVPKLAEHIQKSVEGIMNTLFNAPSLPSISGFIDTANACFLLLASGGLDPTAYYQKACNTIRVLAWITTADRLIMEYQPVEVETELDILNVKVQDLEQTKQKQADALVLIEDEAASLKRQKDLEEERLKTLKVQVVATEKKISELTGAHAKALERVLPIREELGQIEHRLERLVPKRRLACAKIIATQEAVKELSEELGKRRRDVLAFI